MLKNKINYKLVNILLILLIILSIYETRKIWITILNTITNILTPLLIAIIISYILNLYLRILSKKFSKKISIIIFLITVMTLIYITIFNLIPKIIIQLKESIDILIYILKIMQMKYNINILDVITKLKYIDEIIPNINIIGSILKYLSATIIVMSISIYLFVDWNKIIKEIKKILKNKKQYNYLKDINQELEKYVKSYLLLSILNILEYGLIFLIIGHPNYLLLGILSGILSIIPMFGGIATNIIAILLAFIINYKLFIRTLIGILILTILDGYIISPIVYKKTNKIHPVLSILTIFIGSKLCGLLGTILAMPLLVILKTTYKYIKNNNILKIQKRNNNKKH
jgi:predicted PurR-regulated permease PerM